MAEWAKIKFLYDTMLGAPGSALAASSTAAGDYSVDYLHNMLEVNMWKAADAASPQYVTYDAGAGNAWTADYLVILGHNLSAAAATVGLQYSDDNFAAHAWDAFTAFAPASDAVVFKEFANPGAYRHWRLVLTGAASAPCMTICAWGNATMLDYATAAFDPYDEEIKAAVNLSYSGCVAGVHARYAERSLSLRFDDADADLYGKIRQWWSVNGLGNFFVAWEGANNPADVWLMRPDARFSNPLKTGGRYRDVSVQLKGRKE
ncbi:MAG: hypothetical protein HY894_07935 [Deltaproteobacteria bacterium]|nr:hypothetical protein [Deltaproteobacteria bacterium]